MSFLLSFTLATIERLPSTASLKSRELQKQRWIVIPRLIVNRRADACC